MKPIYIYGASGHGLVVADIAKACGYTRIIFIDDGDNDFPNFTEIESNKQIPIIVAIGSNTIREKLLKQVLSYGFELVTLIHPSAIVSTSVTIDIGTVVMPNVVINSHSNIGRGVILNTASIIEHECNIKDFVHISPNVALAGDVHIGQGVHVGIGSSIIQGVNIGKESIIGAGSVVVRNIVAYSLAYGNPCRIVRRINE